eukprot:TRINITY_DN4741_c0_g1_i1.p1 TRINITY_DN4741_c0_g1~~TRINITY_DN4741_c0_g1_i1.p1  ORF type:complete len:753 (-),score=314.86 TRINITY_DN4741_c0_g1_i1:86-2344(-)
MTVLSTQSSPTKTVGILSLVSTIRKCFTAEYFAKNAETILQRGSIAGLVGLAVWIYFSYRKRRNHKMTAEESEASKKKKLDNKKFYTDLVMLLKIVIPTIHSKEFFLLLLHTSFLIIRTFLSIYVARLDGRIVRALVETNGWEFLKMMCYWLGIAIPATYVNSMIKFLESKLALAFRSRLTEHTMQMYMSNEMYYRVLNLDSRMSNADQCLTEDLSRFSSLLAHVHSQLSKPILDVALNTVQLYNLSRSRGDSTSAILPTSVMTILVIWGSAELLRYFQPPFGRMAAEQAKREGDFRFVHSRLIANSEEVAFYGGENIEKGVIAKSYQSLVSQMNTIFKSRIFYGMLEGFLLKYVWSTCGLGIVALPAFFYRRKEGAISDEGVPMDEIDTISARTGDYVTSKKLLNDAAEAIERIMLASKDINELAGYSSRVADMIRTFKDINQGKYVKTMTSNGKEKPSLVKGTIEESNEAIEFDKVMIVSPNGDVLVESLTFKVERGQHLLITGPNGCGKSSLFRILGDLWPVYGGVVKKPSIHHLFYIPQRPYLSLGNLRDQIIYPDTHADMKTKGWTDAQLIEVLGHVNLGHILEREGGWDSVNDWKDVLSGGEKQRIGMARLFYHKPLFAILDECTSAVSIDVEGKMYQHAIDIGITLMTVTHRPSLWKFHNYLLQYDGEGGYSFTQLNAGARLSLKEEKSKIEGQLLGGTDRLRKRLKELCALLGEDSVLLKGTEDVAAAAAAAAAEELGQVDETA